MTASLLLPLLAALFTSSVEVLYRLCLRRGCDAWTMAVLNSLTAGLCLLVAFPVPELPAFSWHTVVCLSLAGFFWALAVLYDIKAYQVQDAAVNAILSTLRFGVLNLAGVVFFAETIDAEDVIGLAVIGVAILYGIRLGAVRSSGEGPTAGFTYRCLSVAFGAAAILMDKYLTTQMDAQLVVLAGYFLPLAFYYLYRPVALRCFAREIALGRGWLLLCGVCFAGSGYFLIHAFGREALWYTIAIYQVKTVLTFLGAAVFLHERDDPKKRAIASVLCVIGVSIVAWK